MTTETTSKWILVIPMNDMPVYSFVCSSTDCQNSVVKFLHSEEWKFLDESEVDPISQCFVCGKSAKEN